MRKSLLVAVFSFCVGGFATYAFAEPQPRMRAALSSLESALSELKGASADKGGHRVKAMHYVESAIAETKAGIAFDNRH